MLKVQGNQIVNEKNEVVYLRGYNIGSWMMLENFMFGYPGTEQEFRAAVKKYAGKENYEYFFDRFLYHFFNEKDVAFLKGIGVTCLRLPFNYRHFECDNRPYEYIEEGFKHLDRAVRICAEAGIYTILDMHGAPGYQNYHWHSDNNNLMPAGMYLNKTNRDRTIALWKHIAEHYKDEEFVAGYDLLNEPAAVNADTDGEGVRCLNQLFKDITAAIREVDPDHIVFIAGNDYNMNFDDLDAPFTDNLAYTPHYYLDVCTSVPARYPGKVHGILYDKSQVELQMDLRDAYMRKYNVPCWVGEFGCRTNYPGFTEDRFRAFADQFDSMVSRGHHYSIWNYKDIGYLSTVVVKQDSAWMKFADEILKLKKKYHVDMNFRVNEDWGITQLLDLKDPEGLNDLYGDVKESIVVAMKSKIASRLADMLGQKFAGLSKDELEELAASFDFDNCRIDEPRLALIKEHGGMNA